MPNPDAIEYITRVDWRHSRLGLERMTRLMALLGNPQDALRFVHVAGTNGKGSTCAMLAGVLAAAGHTTGLFTSPYITRFNERMQVNGVCITDAELDAVTETVRRAADTMDDHPTEFELVTAVGIVWFVQRRCDVVVLEVGLGGRLDATNIIQTPLLALITTISYDHMAQLGDTLPRIAGEKAGIIKPGGQVLLYPQRPEVDAVFVRACAEVGATLHRVDLAGLVPHSASLEEGQCFSYGGLENLRLGLLGPYQLKNAATVITAARLLQTLGLPVGDEAIREGLAQARWPARFELVQKQPPVIVDGGHNPEGAAALLEGMRLYFPGKKLVLLAGVMADKDYETTYQLVLPHTKRVVCVTPDNPRSLPAQELAAFFAAHGLPARACATVAQGVAAALAAAGPQDVVCAFGSFYMAGEVRACFLADGEKG